MNMYDRFIEKLKSTFGEDYKKSLVPGVNTSSVMAAELLLMASIIIAAMTIRLVSPALMIFVVVALILLFVTKTPIMPKLYKEHNDNINNMMFYAVLSLAIIAIVFYWGAL